MKRDRGRLNSRTRETRNIPSLMPSLAVLRVTRRMRSMHTMASTARRRGSSPRPSRARPRPALGRDRAHTFNFTSKAVQNRLEGHRTGVHINTVPTARGTRAIPFRRTFPGHRTSGIQQCVCLVSCHGSPRCFQTGIPVSTRLINRHGVTMKSRNFPQLCVCSHASVTNSVPAA